VAENLAKAKIFSKTKIFRENFRENEISRNFAKICSFSLTFRFSRKRKSRFSFQPYCTSSSLERRKNIFFKCKCKMQKILYEATLHETALLFLLHKVTLHKASMLEAALRVTSWQCMRFHCMTMYLMKMQFTKKILLVKTGVH
jgi:hypothetical protein